MNRKIIASIFLLAILISCSTPETGTPTQNTVLLTPPSTDVPEGIDIGDGGLLSGLPCPSPCAFGVRIGETQFDQVIPLLEKNGVSHCQTEQSISWVLVYCGEARFNVQADAHTNIVNGIWFYPNVAISLGEIIKKYGDPNFFVVRSEGTLESPPITAQMYLYWDSVRMGVGLRRLDGKVYIVEKTTDVEGVGFLDEAIYPGSFQIEFGEFYKLWTGYGAYHSVP